MANTSLKSPTVESASVGRGFGVEKVLEVRVLNAVVAGDGVDAALDVCV